MTEEEMELIAYRLIRIETNKFDRSNNDTELGSYVRAIVNMQTELYHKLVELKGEN